MRTALRNKLIILLLPSILLFGFTYNRKQTVDFVMKTKSCKGLEKRRFEDCKNILRYFEDRKTEHFQGLPQVLVCNRNSTACLRLRHPFYLGIVHFKHNATSHSIETDVKLFVNDLEAALKKLNNKPVDLINGTNKTELNAMINSYVQARLAVNINEKKCDFNYIGFEVEKDVVWIYLEYKNIKTIKTLTVETSLLYDYIKQQSNIIRVEYNATEQNKKLNYPEKSVKLSF